MSISTYSELQTAIKNWLKRSDLDSHIPDFISIAEARIGREVKARQMESRVSSTPSDQYINLPADYVSMRAIRIKGSRLGWFTFVVPDRFFEMFASTTPDRSSKYYTIFGDEVIFPYTPEGDVELWYFRKLDPLSSDTNTLFTDNPDLYLYAALAAAHPFMKNDARIPLWESLYGQVRDSVNEQHKEGRYPSGMAVKVA